MCVFCVNYYDVGLFVVYVLLLVIVCAVVFKVRASFVNIISCVLWCVCLYYCLCSCAIVV